MTAFRLTVGFVSVPVYIHFVGMSQWGLLMLFQAAAAPVALLDLGTGAAVVKRVAEALGRDDTDAAGRSVRAALVFHAVVLAVGAALLLVASGWFARSVFAIPDADLPVALRGFRFVALSWAAGAALSLFSNVLIAHQRYDEVVRASTFAIVATTGAGLASAAATRDAGWILLAQAVGTTIAALFAFHRAAVVLPGIRQRPRWDAVETRRLLGFGVWQVTASVGVLLANWADRWILGGYFAPRVVGFYSLAHTLQQQAYSIFIEASDVLFPAVSHRHGMGQLSAARRLALLAGWLLTTAFGPAAISLGLVGGDFLRLWISPEAAHEATPVLRLLCAAGIAALPAVAPVTFAMGIGRSHWQAPFSWMAAVAAVGTSLALVPTLGLAGVGIGLLAGAIARWALLVVLWRSVFREDVSGRDFALCVWAPPVVSLALLAALVPLHDSVQHTPGWIALFGEATLVFSGVALLQVGLGEVLPGGRARRRNVVESFRPVAVRALDLLRRRD